MKKFASSKEKAISRQLDCFCEMVLHCGLANFYKHMEYQRKHEASFEELSGRELSLLYTLDEYAMDQVRFPSPFPFWVEDTLYGLGAWQMKTYIQQRIPRSRAFGFCCIDLRLNIMDMRIMDKDSLIYLMESRKGHKLKGREQ